MEDAPTAARRDNVEARNMARLVEWELHAVGVVCDLVEVKDLETHRHTALPELIAAGVCKHHKVCVIARWADDCLRDLICSVLNEDHHIQAERSSRVKRDDLVPLSPSLILEVFLRRTLVLSSVKTHWVARMSRLFMGHAVLKCLRCVLVVSGQAREEVEATERKICMSDAVRLSALTRMLQKHGFVVDATASAQSVILDDSPDGRATAQFLVRHTPWFFQPAYCFMDSPFRVDMQLRHAPAGHTVVLVGKTHQMNTVMSFLLAEPSSELATVKSDLVLDTRHGFTAPKVQVSEDCAYELTRLTLLSEDRPHQTVHDHLGMAPEDVPRPPTPLSLRTDSLDDVHELSQAEVLGPALAILAKANRVTRTHELPKRFHVDSLLRNYDLAAEAKQVSGERPELPSEQAPREAVNAVVKDLRRCSEIGRKEIAELRAAELKNTEQGWDIIDTDLRGYGPDAEDLLHERGLDQPAATETEFRCSQSEPQQPEPDSSPAGVGAPAAGVAEAGGTPELGTLNTGVAPRDLRPSLFARTRPAVAPVGAPREAEEAAALESAGRSAGGDSLSNYSQSVSDASSESFSSSSKDGSDESESRSSEDG